MTRLLRTPHRLRCQSASSRTRKSPPLKGDLWGCRSQDQPSRRHISLRTCVVFACIALAFGLTGCATGSHRITNWRGGGDPPLEAVAAKYYEGCVCSSDAYKKHNCTHFLSNAFIRAGYTELLDSPLITARCPSGRPLRAQDLQKWFQTKSKNFYSGIPKPGRGLWAIYQEKPGAHHVLLLDTGTGKVYGTANCVKWPVQWCYQW